MGIQNDEEVSRRVFLERLAGAALLGAAGAYGKSARPAPHTTAWTPPPVLTNPNILIVMVDQLRPPMWLDTDQSATLSQTVLPNIMGRIQNNSYNFEQFFSAATVCTASRATLLTGLYAPQTAMYITGFGSTIPALNPAYPTWGEALPLLNPAYEGNMWWFGKWHLSSKVTGSPLLPYGFKTRTYPGGPRPYNPSPNGMANEGSDGGTFRKQVWASDAMIADDFIGWIQGQAPTNGQPASPWCATVSLINPHDISDAPAWMQTNPFPPVGVPAEGVYFAPPTNGPPSFYTSMPSPWNWENLPNVPHKPTLQNSFLTGYLNKRYLPVSDWVLFLNQYFWLQYLVDQQIGYVLDALAASPFADNTIVVFLSDHGEYAGSHGLHDKGRAAYEESIRVPLYVQFPGQSGTITMNQMCSGVDFFGLICDLATGGSGTWAQTYPDLANRQSLWSFLVNNGPETRVAPAPVGLPYIFHTYDQQIAKANNGGKCHIVCMRTKLDLDAGQVGAKIAFYSEWAPCTTYPNSTAPDPEFYDYNPQTTNNTSEIGNDYFSKNATTQNTIAEYVQVLGSMIPPATGLIATELNPPLVGTGTDGNPLSAALATAQETYFDYQSGPGCLTP